MAPRVPTELRTERLWLRPWRLEEDLDPLAEIHAQPEYQAHMPKVDRAGTRAMIERILQRWETDGMSQWAAVEVASGRLIGHIGLMRHHDWPLWADPVEVGWSLHRDFHGRGFATEGGRAAVDVWRRCLPQDLRLISITRPFNWASRMVMDRLGFTLRGETTWREQHVVWYALDRPGC